VIAPPASARFTACLITVAALACVRADTKTPSSEPVADLDPVVELAPAQPEDPAVWIAANYHKREVRIPMRDGATLFTVIYSPREPLHDPKLGALPMLMVRTPYAVGPYGEDQFPAKLGPHPSMMRDGYIFVYQDVRGRFMSDGEFVNMTPHRPNKAKDKPGPADIDESTDTYDTIAWLLDNVEGHNGRVGQWGISYPGFYAAAAVIDAHPALVAVSPQAPIADWWYDDFHHQGAFFLPHLFNFIYGFGQARDGLVQKWPDRFEHGTHDGYEFFMRLGTAANANEHHFHGKIAFWDEVMAHPNYDEFWQARNLLPHLERVAALGPAVMTVGGWFDAEDLYGPLHVYAALERADPNARNTLVMGPWRHGGWARTEGDRLGDVSFGRKTSLDYQFAVERRFFAVELGHPVAAEYEGCAALPEAFMFETGTNRWRQFEQWPPTTQPTSLHMAADGKLESQTPSTRKRSFDAFVSDPARPVPFTTAVAKGMTAEYMTDDQRFAARRADVLVYQTEVLTEALTIAGPVNATLWVSTDQRDADWVVKLIDVFPDGAGDHEALREGMHMGGYQMMVRSEVMRGRFREDPSTPKPFVPGQPTRVDVPLQDVLHTFEPGHRVMIQVQSTWFPLVDRNPQKWVKNVFEARDEDFVAATHRVWHEAKHPSRIEAVVIPTPPAPAGAPAG
jgi:putative CocE/NonD family hydrolase